MSPDREQEYAELSAFLDYYSTHVWGIDPSSEGHPTSVRRYIEAEYGRSKALTGLRMAVNDTVEMMAGARASEVEKLDAELRARNIVTFSEIRRRYAAAYKRILKRGKIRTETEYYVVAAVLADVSSCAGQEERETLGRLVLEYERGV